MERKRWRGNSCGTYVIRASDMQRGRQTFLALVLQSGSSSLSGLKFLSSTEPLPEDAQIFLKYGSAGGVILVLCNQRLLFSDADTDHRDQGALLRT